MLIIEISLAQILPLLYVPVAFSRNQLKYSYKIQKSIGEHPKKSAWNIFECLYNDNSVSIPSIILQCQKQHSMKEKAQTSFHIDTDNKRERHNKLQNRIFFVKCWSYS